MEFWQEKPATESGMLLQEDVDDLSEIEKSDIISQLPWLGGKKVLELGAGIGRFTSYLAQVADHVTAVDFVERFLSQNRKSAAKFNNISYYCADVMDLEFEPASFDFVFMNWLLMYLGDDQMAILRDRIREWTRVGASVFFRESCFIGPGQGVSLKDNPARYRPDDQYTRLFEENFGLLHQGTVKVYDERLNRSNQHYWLFIRKS
jgi:phosphoethanolamine N-methyltransferase